MAVDTWKQLAELTRSEQSYIAESFTLKDSEVM